MLSEVLARELTWLGLSSNSVVGFYSQQDNQKFEPYTLSTLSNPYSLLKQRLEVVRSVYKKMTGKEAPMHIMATKETVPKVHDYLQNQVGHGGVYDSGDASMLADYILNNGMRFMNQANVLNAPPIQVNNQNQRFVNQFQPAPQVVAPPPAQPPAQPPAGQANPPIQGAQAPPPGQAQGLIAMAQQRANAAAAGQTNKVINITNIPKVNTGNVLKPQSNAPAAAPGSSMTPSRITIKPVQQQAAGLQQVAGGDVAVNAGNIATQISAANNKPVPQVGRDVGQMLTTAPSSTPILNPGQMVQAAKLNVPLKQMADEIKFDLQAIIKFDRPQVAEDVEQQSIILDGDSIIGGGDNEDSMADIRDLANAMIPQPKQQQINNAGNMAHVAQQSAQSNAFKRDYEEIKADGGPPGYQQQMPLMQKPGMQQFPQYKQGVAEMVEQDIQRNYNILDQEDRSKAEAYIEDVDMLNEELKKLSQVLGDIDIMDAEMGKELTESQKAALMHYIQLEGKVKHKHLGSSILSGYNMLEPPSYDAMKDPVDYQNISKDGVYLLNAGSQVAPFFGRNIDLGRIKRANAQQYNNYENMRQRNADVMLGSDNLRDWAINLIKNRTQPLWFDYNPIQMLELPVKLQVSNPKFLDKNRDDSSNFEAYYKFVQSPKEGVAFMHELPDKELEQYIDDHIKKKGFSNEFLNQLVDREKQLWGDKYQEKFDRVIPGQPYKIPEKHKDDYSITEHWRKNNRKAEQEYQAERKIQQQAAELKKQEEEQQRKQKQDEEDVVKQMQLQEERSKELYEKEKARREKLVEGMYKPPLNVSIQSAGKDEKSIVIKKKKKKGGK